MADYGTEPVSFNHIFNKVMLKDKQVRTNYQLTSRNQRVPRRTSVGVPKFMKSSIRKYHNFLEILFRIAMQKVLAVKYLILTSFFFQGECFLHSLQSNCSNQNRDESWNYGLDYWRCSLPNRVIV